MAGLRLLVWAWVGCSQGMVSHLRHCAMLQLLLLVLLLLPGLPLVRLLLDLDRYRVLLVLPSWVRRCWEGAPPSHRRTALLCVRT